MRRQSPLDAAVFRTLPTEQIAQLVRANGPKVCVFPINGTRRWFLLEHGQTAGPDWFSAYVTISEQRHLELYRLFFDHGVENLLTPIFGPDLLERGTAYIEMAANGLADLCQKPTVLAFYQEHQVRVRFYGDHRKYFGPTPYAYLSDLFDDLTARTAHHHLHKLFFGVFAHDAVETTGELAVQYYLQHGKTPDKRTLIEQYYGEYVPPVDLFIGFDKFCAFDMPLITTGNEDLYFTVSPSPYLSEQQLRDILYDHLFARRDSEPDYSTLSAAEWEAMRTFYRTNVGNTCGIGARRKPAGYWYPLPQVNLPHDFDDSLS
jgi:tuberculosinol/isotuberculosinol synthase